MPKNTSTLLNILWMKIRQIRMADFLSCRREWNMDKCQSKQVYRIQVEINQKKEVRMTEEQVPWEFHKFLDVFSEEKAACVRGHPISGQLPTQTPDLLLTNPTLYPVLFRDPPDLSRSTQIHSDPLRIHSESTQIHSESTQICSDLLRIQPFSSRWISKS